MPATGAISDPVLNASDPLILNSYAILTETITVAAPLTTDCFSLIRRDGLAVVGGGRVLGVVAFTRPCPNGDVLATVMSEGIAIVRVEPGVTINSGQPLATTVNANARVAVGGEYAYGNAIDETDGSSTAARPHYVRVRLSTGSIV